MTLKYRHIASLLETSRKSWSKYLSYGGLGIGILLLLCSVQLFMNLQKFINNDNPRKAGADFISITKTVTNETMGTPDKNLFSPADIEEIKRQPFIEDAAPLLANQFHVKASAGNIIPFSTDLFLEALDEDFLDTVPPDFSWREGQETIPLIFSADFLEVYNVLAPGQGYPQVSDETMGTIQIVLSCYGPTGRHDFKAYVAALTNRVNSVLVPEEFLTWANKRFGMTDNILTTRVFVKTKDANNPDFLRFLDQKNYRVNKDKIKFGRVKAQLQIVVSGLGIIGLLVVVLALMLFSFYLQLIIAKSKDNLQLLLMLGYEPGWLSRVVSRRWVPIYISIVLIALGITWLFQYFVYLNTHKMESSMSPMLHWSVLAFSAALIFLTIYSNYRIIRKQLYKLS
ncbi:MAG TPA: hypothetical protein VD993_19355 [Chitinophagaceae bacterium]|nr:hypothetical protein [Chitinophagaceae bacterium]